MSLRPSRQFLVIALSVLAGTTAACAPRRETPVRDDHQPASAPADATVATNPLTQPAEVSSETHRTTSDAAANVVEFRPGIRIDYRVPQVELSCEVILRTGELELFAYAKSPTPKEHETILLMHVLPEHVYQALGLIGLTPGNPIMYDWETEKITEASGDPVDVLVRYERDGASVEEPATQWMLDLARQATMRPTHWIFTGSRKDERGRFAANVEGTVVTVVNFDTALLSLPESHSDSDDSLWLAARTEAIPPVGTSVTLILRPADAGRLQRR